AALPRIWKLQSKPVMILGAAVHLPFAKVLHRSNVYPHLLDLLLSLELLPVRQRYYLELRPIPNKGEMKLKACRFPRKPILDFIASYKYANCDLHKRVASRERSEWHNGTIHLPRRQCEAPGYSTRTGMR